MTFMSKLKSNFILNKGPKYPSTCSNNIFHTLKFKILLKNPNPILPMSTVC